MYIENIAELAESVYFKVFQELSLDDLDSGFIKLDDDGLGTTENTNRGRDLYYAIEAEIESYFAIEAELESYFNDGTTPKFEPAREEI